MSYKYDFELSSKRKTFLWLYQVIPNIDIIKYIYLLKEHSELEDTRMYYGVCPSYITVPRMKHTWKEFVFSDRMKLTSLFMKLIMEPGFICTFHFNDKDYDQVELNEINNCNWVAVVPNINYNPTLQEKIKIMNVVYDSIFLLTSELYNKLLGLHYWFKHTYGQHNIFRIGYDQQGGLYIPSGHFPVM